MAASLLLLSLLPLIKGCPLATTTGFWFHIEAGEDLAGYLWPCTHFRAPQPGQTHESKPRGQQATRHGAVPCMRDSASYRLPGSGTKASLEEVGEGKGLGSEQPWQQTLLGIPSHLHLSSLGL